MKRLYIGNISYNTTEKMLKNAFGAFESVVSVKIIKDRFSNQSRGFGFIVFSNDDEAIQAIEDLDGYELDGKDLVVNEALPKRTKASDIRGFNKKVKQRGRGSHGNILTTLKHK